MQVDLIKTIASFIVNETDDKKIADYVKALTVASGIGPASSANLQPTPELGAWQEKEVCYGHRGFTDEHDPRTPAMRTHAYDPSTGRVTAVWGGVLVQPNKRYRCVLVDLLPADQSCNLYVEVYDKNGNAASKNLARQLTGWRESATDYDALYDAPQSPGAFEMAHDGKFFKDSNGAMPLGPYGVCIVDGAGNIDSDIAGSFGLPNGQHTSYRICFRER
jgi:hypothetical protein